jgi:hypothetical protein
LDFGFYMRLGIGGEGRVCFIFIDGLRRYLALSCRAKPGGDLQSARRKPAPTDLKNIITNRQFDNL